MASQSGFAGHAESAEVVRISLSLALGLSWVFALLGGEYGGFGVLIYLGCPECSRELPFHLSPLRLLTVTNTGPMSHPSHWPPRQSLILQLYIQHLFPELQLRIRPLSSAPLIILSIRLILHEPNLLLPSPNCIRTDLSEQPREIQRISNPFLLGYSLPLLVEFRAKHLIPAPLVPGSV